MLLGAATILRGKKPSLSNKSVGFNRNTLPVRFTPYLQQRATILNMPTLQEIPYLEGTVLVDPAANIGRHVIRDGVYEPNLIKLIQHCSKAGFNYVDVGANIGLHTLAAGFAGKTQGITLTAFEPEPTIFQQLTQNCEQNGLAVTLHQMGVGSEPGELTLYQSTDHNEGSHSFIHRDNTSPAGSVPVKTLDAIFAANNVAEPTFIKMDVEGFEAHVLRGGQTWLGQLENAVVMLEVTPPLLEQATGKLDLLAELNAAGFLQKTIIHDFDTFDEFGNLYNDYFNIACWKGKKANEVMVPIIAEIGLKRWPFNVPQFVNWQDYSSQELLPRQSRQSLIMAQAITELEAKIHLQEFTFQPTVIGRLRHALYSFAAKWSVRHTADQQSMINQEMLEMIKKQQAEIDLLRNDLNN